MLSTARPGHTGALWALLDWDLAWVELGGGWNGRLEDPSAPTRPALSGPTCLPGPVRAGLVTGPLFFVSQGSWVRSSSHLQPRMIG